jgi:hypothetical protein
MYDFHLRFPITDISALAEAYWGDSTEAADIARERHIEQVLAPQIQRQRYLTKEQFQYLCRWKSPRATSYAARNDEAFIHAVTHTALTTDHERLRIEVLTLLAGVQWPTASVILHFGCDNLYPILDVRALWSAGIDNADTIPHDFELWQAYTIFCRQTALAAGVTLRTLDRALWQHAAARIGASAAQ